MPNTPDLWALLLAAGHSSRLKASGLARAKQFICYNNLPLYLHSALTLAKNPRVGGLVFVFPEQDFLEHQGLLIDYFGYFGDHGEAKPWLAVVGGERRQDSVFQGLQALPPDCRHVLVHDAARPFVSATLVERVVQALDNGAQAVIPAIAVKDTIKRVHGELVAETLPRSELAAVQTPQGFLRQTLVQAHEQARAEGWEATDDASLIERLGLPVSVVQGEEANRKITTADDLALLGEKQEEPVVQFLPCTGLGYDVHRYVPADSEKARPLKLGGVPIKGPCAVAAHSDGDVLLHALADAMLGLLGQGDIGDRFPDTDPSLDGLESGIFVNEILQDLLAQGISVTHVDTTIVAQVPRLAPHREQIRNQVASLLGLQPSQVNVKATTEEGLGFTGEKKGIKAMAVVTGLKPCRKGILAPEAKGR